MPLVVFAPVVAKAQGVGSELDTWLLGVVNFIDNVLVPFIFAIAFLIFIWGIIQTFILGGQDEEKRANGRQLMLYAIIAFVVILAFWGIVHMLVSATGLENQNINTPNFPVPGSRGGGGSPSA